MATVTETVVEGSQAAGRPAQVRVLLKTKSSDIELPPGTGPILVPTELRRYQLSTLVNRLIETEKPIPLEFLINGQFLRTSLDDFLAENNISTETTLNVEYVRALVPPAHIGSFQHDDWVSSVDVLSSTSNATQWSTAASSTAGLTQNRILSGSYDGMLRIWNMSAEVIATGHAHTAAIKSAKFLSPSLIATAGVDRTLRLWKFADADIGTAQLTPSLELYGHQSSVDSIAVHTPSARLLSASSDTTVGVWSTKKSDAPSAPSALLPPPSTKRRKLSAPSNASPAPQRGPLALLTAHTQPVSDVVFDATDATVGYSTSHDHTLRTWDLPTARNIDTRHTAQPLFALAHLPSQNLLAAGGALRYISLVDPRASATAIGIMTLRGHTNAVSALAPDPVSPFRFASASHDGSVRIWDLRSARAEVTDDAAPRVGDSVFVIERESAAKGATPPGRVVQGDEQRVFDLAWDRDVGIVSAGRDKTVQINKEP